jgi:hypothetical protein
MSRRDYAEAEQNAINDEILGIVGEELEEAFYGPAHLLEGDDDDDSLGSVGESFNPYVQLDNDEDYDDLQDLRLILNKIRKRENIRCPKFQHRRCDWDYHRHMLISTKEFENRFRMPPSDFDTLLEVLREALTVSVKHSQSSTKGNDPICPEVILACGLRFCGLGDNPGSLADMYGMSVPSAKRAIRIFLNAIDYNVTCPELQIELPDPTNNVALTNLKWRWQQCSTAAGIFEGFLGPVDGWLPRTEAPKDVNNQADYYSGHYQCYGLNCQALCDPDLIFMYFCIAAPGKTNDIRAYDRCVGLKQWLARLPPEFFTGGDNAYTLTRKMLTPYTNAEMRGDNHKRTYNYYFSQLRIRIEMAFGLLTTKWRRLRSTLNYYNHKNAQIIRVCTKLHNFCIRMKMSDSDYYTPVVRGDGRSVNPSEHGIEPLSWGTSSVEVRRFGFLETSPGTEEERVDYTRLVPPDDTRRTEILTKFMSVSSLVHPTIETVTATSTNMKRKREHTNSK